MASRVRKSEATTEAPDLKKLDQVIQSAETEAKEQEGKVAHSITFGNAHATKEVPIDPRYPSLVARTFAPKNWEDALDRYDAWRSLGDKRTEEAYIRRAHEAGAEILQELYDCYFQVRAAREIWEAENDSIVGDMRDQATAVLQDEKERKIRTKAITEADVDAKCAKMFSDEWSRQRTARMRAKLTEDRMKSCIEVAGQRCRALDQMMSKLR